MRPRTTTSKPIACATALALFAAPACAHRIRLDTTPPGAKVSVNGRHQGETPLLYVERTGWGKEHEIEIQRPGSEPVHDRIKQTEWDGRVLLVSLLGAVVTFGLSLAGLLFSRRAEDHYHWKLKPAAGAADPAPTLDAPLVPATDPAEPIEYPEPPSDYPEPR